MKRTFSFESKSDFNASHTVTLHEDGRLTCSCRGFRTPRKCWHVRSVAETQGLNIVIGGELFGGNSITGYAVKTEPKAAPLVVDLQAVARAERKASGGFVKPMLASALPEGKSIADYESPEYVLEQKVDGHRLIVERNGTTIAWSRQGKTRMLAPHILAALERLPDCTVDGELYIPGGTSTDVTALHTLHTAKLVLFDILRVGGESTMDLPGHERRALLEMACSKLEKNGPVHIIDQFDVSAATLDAIWAAGLEGVVIKRRDARYRAGARSKDWIKFKKLGAAEVIITGFEAGKLGPYSKVVGVDAAGVEVTVKSLNDLWRDNFATFSDRFIGRTMVISYQEKTRDGRYRHPMADHILD